MRPGKSDVLLVIASIVLGVTVYWSADQIPPSLMSNISAGLVPKIIAIAMIALAILFLLLTYLNSPGGASTPPGAPVRWISGLKAPGASRPIWITSALLLVFLMAIEWKVLPFWLSGGLFCFLAVLALSSFSLKNIAISAAVAVLSIIVTLIVFTRVFTVILP
uniref:tripartite tricarboxylate transporter TctB family protein n=1 Tax=Pararhizobium sp. IMCC3301 TaxID=3067904 RepID=UPI00274115A9|nr:tripartite tricarboxylate transporter TctB family protein [Pararhizobium sp. IMCC3301]